MNKLFLEDLMAGQTFGSRSLRIETEDIKRFAAEFDPQPFHIDEQAARETMFRGLGLPCDFCEGEGELLCPDCKDRRKG